MTGVTKDPLPLHKRGALVDQVTAAVCNCLMLNLGAQSLSQSSVKKSKVKIAPATQRTNAKVLISPKMPLKQNAVNLQQQLYMLWSGWHKSATSQVNQRFELTEAFATASERDHKSGPMTEAGPPHVLIACQCRQTAVKEAPSTDKAPHTFCRWFCNLLGYRPGHFT